LVVLSMSERVTVRGKINRSATTKALDERIDPNKVLVEIYAMGGPPYPMVAVPPIAPPEAGMGRPPRLGIDQ